MELLGLRVLIKYITGSGTQTAGLISGGSKDWKSVNPITKKLEWNILDRTKDLNKAIQAGQGFGTQQHSIFARWEHLS